MRQIWRIVTATRSLWRYYLAISIFTIVLSLLNLAMPALTGFAIDEISKGTAASYQNLVWLAVLIAATDFGANILGNFSGYLGDMMAVKVQRILSNDYFRHILSLPQRYFDTELTGKIINRLSRSINQISNFMNMLANNFLQFIFSTIFALVIVALYSWQVALLLTALYPVFIVLTVASSPKWVKLQQEKNQALDVSSGRFAEAIGEVRAVKSFNQEAYELNFFRKHLDRFVDLTKPQSRYWHNWDTWRRLVLNLIFLGVYLFIFTQAVNGDLSAGSAVALILYGMQIRIPLFTISFLVGQTQRSVADSREYFAAMDEEPQLADAEHAGALEVKVGKVVFDQVSFRYDQATPVLKKISFILEPGTRTALVGESGEGKTTMTNLLLRLYDIDDGLIAIDGQDIRSVTQQSLRQNIGMVFQDPTLFSGTIRENIAYASPGASQKAIVAAAKAANAAEFIDKLDLKYETEIGERGLKLSGGQKQRIAIARALLKDAPILVLDEATSSLDSKSERMVQQALDRLMKGRTTLIIAHRLSTIATVDTIVTLKNGQVDEIGSPEDLIKSGGIYAQLLQLQAAATEHSRRQLQRFDMGE